VSRSNFGTASDAGLPVPGAVKKKQGCIPEAYGCRWEVDDKSIFVQILRGGSF
jgi:hypothetical protein